MPVILEKVVLAILLLSFGAVTVTNPWGLDVFQRVTFALAALFAMTCVAYTIHKSKPVNRTAPTVATPTLTNPPATVPPTAKSESTKPEHHPPPTAPAPKPSPKPVLNWQGYMGHQAITPEFFTVRPSEYPPSPAGEATLSLYLENKGNADLNRAKFYIEYESGYEVVPDKPFDVISIEPERGVRGFSMDIQLIRPAPAEPFRFLLKIKHFYTQMMKLYCKVEADEIPVPMNFTPIQVMHRGSR